ncbi:MAG: FAD/NAD(P)-binding protein [Armatimonadetes bacterium]|nr:FAD/NAD(P)-binding protein [Armatimonadota bacterium]
MNLAIAARPEPICGSETMLPVPVRILDMHPENFNTRTVQVQIVDEGLRQRYRWVPGQFNMIYVPGIGEAAISISSDPDQHEAVGHTIRLVGSVTRAIERIGKGGMVGLRGPFGRGWPLDRLHSGDVILIGGGIGLAPLRPVVYWLLKHRDRFRRVMLLFGCRTPEDRLFVPELEKWDEDPRIDTLVTVDNATGEWVGPVGVVTKLLQRIRINADRTTAFVCGPRMLNRAAAWSLEQLNVRSERVFISLERNMNCGFGQCGHCQYGSKFVCKDGPVFALSEIADIFAKEEV